MRLLPVSFNLTLVLALTWFCTHTALAQCTTNFNPGYRAVDKLYNGNGAKFRLDDWNGDGRKDFWNWRVNGDGTTYSVVIYPSLPGGYWDWLHPITLFSRFYLDNNTYTVKDFDGDGLTDIYVSNRVYQNLGNTALTDLPTLVPTQQFPVYITIGFYDINNDGKLDWLYAGRNPNQTTSLRYQPWTAGGNFGTAVVIADQIPNIQVDDKTLVFTDVNGDGLKDLFLHFGDSPTGSFRVFTNQGNGTFAINAATIFNAYYNGVVKDMNNDGRADFVSYFQSKLVILYGQANSTFNRVEYPSVPYIGISNPVADLNGDGFADIITFDNYTPNVGLGGYTTIINNGGTGFTPISYQRRLKILRNDEFTVEDVNADGKADIYETAESSTAAKALNANTYNESVFVVYENQCQKRSLPADSFADDNKADIVTWNTTTGNWSWRNWDDVSSPAFQWGDPGDVPAPGDFDGDGRLDPTVYRDSTGVWYSMLSATNTYYALPFGLPGDIPAPGDYDGDNRTDFAVYRPSDGNWHFWYTGSQSYTGIHFGISEDKPVPADFDGDGVTDIAVYRPSQGYWFWLNSGSAYSFSVTQYGINTDVPVPADYDGDGKADQAVFRGGTWYILRSTNGASTGFSWGLPTDVPLPFNRTGYSSTPTVYRPSTFRWYDFKYTFYSQFGSENVVPVKIALPNH